MSTFATGKSSGLADPQAGAHDLARTPLHELWLKDPGGNLIEVYARLTPEQLAEMPSDQEPVFLVGPA